MLSFSSVSLIYLQSPGCRIATGILLGREGDWLSQGSLHQLCASLPDQQRVHPSAVPNGEPIQGKPAGPVPRQPAAAPPAAAAPGLADLLSDLKVCKILRTENVGICEFVVYPFV